MTREERTAETVEMLKVLKEQALKSHNDTAVLEVKIDSFNFVIEQAIKALEQEPCDDVVSRQYLLENCVVDKVTMPYVPINRIQEAPSVRPQEPKKWIPVSEEEPFLYNPKTAKEAHKGIRYLTTLSNGNVAITKRKFYISGNVGGRLFGKWEWSTRGETKVIAWMPLPEPYEPQESEG